MLLLYFLDNKFQFHGWPLSRRRPRAPRRLAAAAPLKMQIIFDLCAGGVTGVTGRPGQLSHRVELRRTALLSAASPPVHLHLSLHNILTYGCKYKYKHG